MGLQRKKQKGKLTLGYSGSENSRARNRERWQWWVHIGAIRTVSLSALAS
jgi:hypothetical protein